MAAHIKRLRAPQMIVLRRHFEGQTNIEIAQATGYTEQSVCNIINSPEGQDILTEMIERSLDASQEAMTDLHAALPEAVKRKIQMLYSPDERLADKAATDIMHMTIGQPVKRIQANSPTAGSQRHEGKTPDEVRAELLKELGELDNEPNKGLLN